MIVGVGRRRVRRAAASSTPTTRRPASAPGASTPIPGPGEPGNETWAGDSWKRGGASVWVTGAYDPELNLVYFGTGNPGPDYHSDSRKGDNLYSDSLVALDVDTGKLRWHYQFTPHDVHDWDSTQVPILADLHDRRPAAQGRDVSPTATASSTRSTGRTGKDPGREAVRAHDLGQGDRQRRPAGAAARPHARRERRGDLSGHRRRHQLLSAVATIRRSGCSSSTRAKSARPTTRGSRTSRPAIASRAAPPSARRGADYAGVRRAARHRSGDRRAQVGIQVPRPRRPRAC